MLCNFKKIADLLIESSNVKCKVTIARVKWYFCVTKFINTSLSDFNEVKWNFIISKQKNKHIDEVSVYFNGKTNSIYIFYVSKIDGI